MKKCTILLLFIFIVPLTLKAEEFYFYYENKDQLTHELKVLSDKISYQEVFSKNEKEILNKSSVHSNILRVSSPFDFHKMRSLFPDIKIEPLQNITRSYEKEVYSSSTSYTGNNYQNDQWYLNNKGGEISYWVSDIDKLTIYASPGEDIQIQDIQEKPEKIRIAVIDSGVDIDHPDLKNKIYKKPSECKLYEAYQNCLNSSQTNRKTCHARYARQDSDGNGYPLDCHGWSFSKDPLPTVSNVTGNPSFTDQDGHGTHVAGIIAAEKNQFGITGVIDNVEILPIQISLFSSAESAIEKMAKGVLYAIQNDVHIINMSLGWRTQFDSKMMREMVALAVSKNILVVVAAGNSSHSDISYPCAYQDVICVGSHDQAGSISSFSNTGGQIDILAPGNRILSTWPQNKRSKQFTEDDNYEYMSGTSQATPLVAGALAKLLNQGLTAQEARVKLLKGTRSKKGKNQIRHGNLDVNKALKVTYTSFIYPLNKTPYLIKWDQSDKKRFLLKLKNYGLKSEKTKIKITALNDNQLVLTKNLEIPPLETGETFQQEIYFEDKDQIESELKFKLTISSSAEQKEYIIKTHYIRLIDENKENDDITKFKITKTLEKNAILRPFTNITATGEIDYFVNHKKGKREFISLLKHTDKGYIRSRALPIRDKMPVYLNFSKVDIDGDSKDDYVIMYVYIDKNKNKISKFLIFNENLMPKRVFISPRNEFPNDKTFIPGKFKWIRQQNKMVPAWIGYGDIATDHYASPWSFPTNTRGNHFYYLTKDGLKNFKLPKDENILNSLYQSSEQIKEGRIDFITTKNLGFYKTYKHYTLSDKANLVEELQVQTFFDIMELRGLPTSWNTPTIFFHEAALNGSQNIYKLSLNNDRIYDEFIRLNNPIQKESIKFIQLVNDELIYFQSNHKILVFDRFNQQYSYRESKVDTRRRRYKTFLKSQTLYLPSAEAPGMTSELLRLNDQGELVSDARYRTLAINNCSEFGTVEKNQEDFIGYICKKANKILLLKVQ